MESLEYSMEATSREEGVTIEVPLPLIPSADDGANDNIAAASTSSTRRRRRRRNRSNDANDNNYSRGNSPFDEAQSDIQTTTTNTNTSVPSSSSSSAGGGPSSYSNDLSNEAVIKTARTTISLAKSHDTNGGHGGGGLAAATATRSDEYDNDNAAAANNNNVNGRFNSNDNIKKQQQQQSTTTNTKSSSSPSYYTKPPKARSFLRSINNNTLSSSLRLREYRHTSCLMTPLSLLVLLAILLSSLLALLLSVPQLLLGILLGPLLRRNFWVVEFLYRMNVARWGHLKIMGMATNKGNKKKKGRDASGGDGAANSKKVGGHSRTLQQRITVVPNRVYIHPIPQFMDNIVYLIVCTPPPPSPPPQSSTNNNKNNNDDDDDASSSQPSSSSSSLPLIGILIDCGESQKVLEHMECIYECHYAHEYPPNDLRRKRSSCGGIELYAILCTHRHHDHTAGVGSLKKELCKMSVESMGGRALRGVLVSSGCSGAASKEEDDGNNEEESEDVYQSVPGNVIVVGGAVEQVPHCNLFVKNGCFVPLPCISVQEDDGGKNKCQVNDMNDIVSIEVIGVPSHTRGSVVYALRNRTAPDVIIPITSLGTTGPTNALPLQSHLFTGDAIFTGGGGVPFESDLELPQDNFIKNPKNLKSKHGSSNFRPGAGVLSMERCFVEVLTRATGRNVWSKQSSSSTPAPQAPATVPPSQTLLYPGHEYTTDLLMRQFDQKTLSPDIQWNKTSPQTFFETASHYLVSAHRRGLPPDQKLLTVPTPLERECVVNPNFRMVRRRGEGVVTALRLWYEYGAENLIPEVDEDGDEADVIVDESNGVSNTAVATTIQPKSVFTTVYSTDLQSVITNLRTGKLDAYSAATQIESLQHRLDDKLIGRRPIPSTLPSHKNVYLGVVALVVLGSGPCAVTVSDACIMNMARPVDSNDLILISKSRLIAALDGLGLLSKDMSPKLEDIIQCLWREARLDDDASDVECSINDDDEIELGLLKLALFGIVLNQQSKFCLPCCGGGGSPKKPTYDARSWVKKSKLRRTNGELVRHDADNCLACRDVLLSCPYSTKKTS